MSEKKQKPETKEVDEMEEMDEYTVVELESEDGEIEEFVVIEQLEVDDATYALMVPLGDMEELSEEEFNEIHGESGGAILMRIDGMDYVEPNDEEYTRIKQLMDEKMANTLLETDKGEAE